MTDPIADMLTRIRNALMVQKTEVLVPFSRLKFEVAKILEKGKWIEAVEKLEENFGQLKITLKYNDKKEPAITYIKRISKPGRRVYVAKSELPIVLNNYGEAIISTSHGIMSNREARKKGVGGEIICEIY